ncbi:unnamed protein product, partial [Mesorhabditis belari]|uniref:rRNA methyltransferase n=1 Tax=Mesorhabditis belari TaxID=2138241 RepID=A0AAF3E9U6_9BILA
MGKKVKIGKQRRDKFYHLAKEAGYRSRAAFKLIQLNKRFEFLQSSRALVDLCAAPGGWMQVAKQNMPVSSICVGVDLVPIKSVHGCISLQGDITEESTRQAIKKELKGFQCDTVLHDGAPNVGMNWIHDAFQQNCLTLMALKMATQILKRNGTFVTKVFRSNDYHHLITVFEKLFKKVHVWKPAASRLESAEIFVVCEKYSKPEKVDPDLLNVKKVFLEPNLDPARPNSQVLLFNKKQKKVKAEGYAEDETITMYKTSTATEFIDSHNYLDLLAKSNSVILDQEKWSASPDTTEEILEYLKDIKTCGPRELRIILKWRKKMKALQESETPTNEMEVEKASEEKTEENPEDKEDRELAEIEAQIAQASATERAALKKKKKKMLLEKAKVLKRKQLKMIHEGDEGPIEEMHDLFSLKSIKKAKMSLLSGDREVPDFKDDEDEDEFGLGQGEWETHGNDGGTNAAEESDEENELIHTEERLMEPTERRAQNVSSWFNKSAITDLLSSDDEDDELDAVERYMRKTKHTFKDNTVSFEEPAKRKKIDDDLEAPNISDFNREMDVESEEEYEDADKRVEKRKPKEESKEAKTSVSKVTELTPEQLALAEQLIYSSKTRSTLITTKACQLGSLMTRKNITERNFRLQENK